VDGDGRYLASQIPGAQIAELPTSETCPRGRALRGGGRRAAILPRLGPGGAAELDRVLATVLFTDIVDSTSTAAVMGDAKWRTLVDEHDRIAKGLIGRYRGEYRKSTGTG